ncbi:hypothetical protein [Sulfitobacter guttiformis]|uniref:Uncharacterized protein n=1 Tax=Sulfitobacter guttiformis TaxID=74349 RepID=A0A420DIU9_9RHOB|nr:hypothetical protein [Sulfitobacter guttiformis]KIN72083.1 hypothetical protein Z949_1252 [Sulfitobacter guttiformis KCTC 32187]RKE94138.1 hypothetical protein C8N30_3247 [Sulfitobacter guttiformis]
MTMTADHSLEPHTPSSAITYMLNGSRLVMRMVCKVGAVSFGLVALLVWFAPGASWESDVMLFKLGLCFMAVFICAALWQQSAPPIPPSVEVDIANLEVRVVRTDSTRPRLVIERCAFSDLEKVDVRGRNIVFWSKGNRLMADFTLTHAATHANLLSTLRSAGKLV